MTRAPITLDTVARLDFTKMGGLLPAIVQDADRGTVLMLGYMSLDALRATLERRRVVFFSRSKQRLWEKGESSGHTLDLVAIEAGPCATSVPRAASAMSP
jgi:phosphoribosyl-AMP cyclohydrolase / phosphoribosyl-ATP pyrophosphohydrolase